MISWELEFHAPTDLAEALDLLAERGEDVTVLSGGMSLMPMMNLGLVKPEIVLSLNRLRDLAHVTDDGDVIRVGATVRHGDLGADPTVQDAYPTLSSAASQLGDLQVRNRGTVGGSVAHAIPGADYPVILMAAGGEVRLDRKGSSRTVPADNFFLGLMWTAREPTELVTEIRVPRRQPGWVTAYRRFTRTEGGIPLVNAAAHFAPAGVGGVVAVGGVVPRPFLLDVPAFDPDDPDEVLDELEAMASVATREQVPSVDEDADYRVAMGGLFARRVLAACIQQLAGGEHTGEPA